jgi:hypothetical protein
MAHYAFLDQNNIVVEVIVGNDENQDQINWEQHYQDFRGLACKRTSYNTHGNVHSNGGIPFRKNYAGIGFIYDEEKDAFIPPKPFLSWSLDEETCLWNPPIPKPSDAGTGNPKKLYSWDETTLSWVQYEQL